MNNKLTLQSSVIFDDANIIDCIRQTCIGLKNSPKEEEIDIFLTESLKLLETQTSFNTINELFAAILSCFKYNSKYITTFLEPLLKIVKNNLNYLVPASFLLSDLICMEQELVQSQYETFVEDYFSYAREQIIKDDTNLLMNETLVNLLLSTNITKERFLNVFPLLFTPNLQSKYPKFDVIIENISKSEMISISNQTEKSDKEICEFIKSQGRCGIKSFSEEAITLIESAVIFIKSTNKKKIKGLKKEKILQFLSVIIIIIKTYKIKKKVNFSSDGLLELIIEGTKYLDQNTSKVLNESIDFIISNYFYINGTLSIPLNTLFEVFKILLKIIQSSTYYGNKLILFQSIFDLFDKIKYYNFREPVTNFIKSNDELILTQMLNHVHEINRDNGFRNNKLNLKLFDQKIIFNKFSEFEDKFQIIYFLMNSCINTSKESVGFASDEINKLLYQKMNERKWDDVFLISKFMQNNGLSSLVDLFNKNSTIPFDKKIALFGYSIESINSINGLLKYILVDPEPEKNDKSFEKLFDLLTQDKKLLHAYLTLLYTDFKENNVYCLENFLQRFKKKYIKYKNDTIIICNKIYNSITSDYIIFKIDFVIDDNIKSDIANSVISMCYKEIESKKICYQAFYCLLNIASSFPILFASDSNKVFTNVYPALNHLTYIFEMKEDEKNLPYIKTGYSALRFLVTTFYSASVIEDYCFWVFKNIKKFSDVQVLFTFQILNMLNENSEIEKFVHHWAILYNFLDCIPALLERKIIEGYFTSCYKDNIYKYVTETYQSYLNYDIYKHAQIEELMKLKRPLVYFYNCIMRRCPRIKKKKLKIDVNSSQLVQYMKDVDKERDFWLTFEVIENHLIDSLMSTELSHFLDYEVAYCTFSMLPNLEKPITLRMARILMMQQFWLYRNVLFSESIPITNKMYYYYEKVIKHLNNIKKKAEQNRDEEEDIDCDSFLLTNHFKSQYCKNALVQSLINEFSLPSLNNKCISSLCNLFHAYASNDEALHSFLSIISQFFTNIYEKCHYYAPPHLLKNLYDLIELLTKMTSIKGFEEIFFQSCGDNLINIVLSPELRCDSILLFNICKFFEKFTNLPIRVIQIIGFVILLDDEKVLSAGISLCQKFSTLELADINSLILNMFDYEIENDKRQSIIAVLITYTNSIIEKRKPQMYSILKGLLKKLLVQYNEKSIELIGTILTKLAPERSKSDDFEITEGKLIKIPLHIKEKDPTFWNLFEKYMEPILKLINDNPNYLSKFQFLSKYSELLYFKVRSMLVRKTMKGMINQHETIKLNIDSCKLLESSFKCIFYETKSNLLKKLYIIFNESKSTVDMGGPTREWLSKLAKEIFNAKYGLFDCTKKMTYQPSDASNIQPFYLQHFKFAGIFVARALIEGQCIDAHLTTSFIKQILHQKLTLKDLEDVDEQLFNSLTWMLSNDVEPLDMYFEIDSEKFGVHRTVPLKENGGQIKVTNENKQEFVELNFQFVLRTRIKDQIEAFCEGFNYLIPPEKINFFSPKEFDLLICGITDFDVDDFIRNITYEYPYSVDHPVIKMLFKVMRSWDNDKLVKLLSFMTGSRRIPANGFKEFVEITGYPLKIGAGGEDGCLPKAHTCFNTIDLPGYKSEEELKNKLLLAIQECDTFGFI